MSSQAKTKPPIAGKGTINKLRARLDPDSLKALSQAVRIWADVKRRGGKVVVATGSGPNLHEGVTTQIAELVRLGLVDGILTSSAVVGHEMAGTLEWVRRVDGRSLGLDPARLPADGKVEAALLTPERLERIAGRTVIDHDYYQRLLEAPGPEIIKVAGNLAYPTGLWVERMAKELLPLAKAAGLPLEQVAGMGADPLTMIGACARRSLGCIVTVPQLVGGGQVGLAVGDSLSITARSAQVARMLAAADLIVESGVALTQEIHDGPFELFTGHGAWPGHEGMFTFSLRDKALVRIDLDPNIRRVWQAQQDQGAVAKSIDRGLPKAASMKVPFRMEMSGFARLPGSLPIEGDVGVVWPLLATRVAGALGVKLQFVCYKQATPQGEALRRYIVDTVAPFSLSTALQRLKDI